MIRDNNPAAAIALGLSLVGFVLPVVSAIAHSANIVDCLIWKLLEYNADEGFIRQAFAPLPNFSNQYPVIGSWLIDHAPCGLSIREDENPVTGNTSRFLPHAIL